MRPFELSARRLAPFRKRGHSPIVQRLAVKGERILPNIIFYFADTGGSFTETGCRRPFQRIEADIEFDLRRQLQLHAVIHVCADNFPATNVDTGFVVHVIAGAVLYQFPTVSS